MKPGEKENGRPWQSVWGVGSQEDHNTLYTRVTFSKRR